MLFELEPPHGVGPLRLGMTSEQSQAALSTLGRVSFSCLGGRYYVVRPGGLFICPRQQGGVVESICLEGPPAPDSDDVVRYRGIDVFATPCHDVVRALRRHTEVIADDHAFIAPALQLTLIRSFDAPDLGVFERVVVEPAYSD